MNGMARRIGSLVLAALTVACGAAPGAPPGPGPGVPPVFQTSLRVVSALQAGAGIASVTISLPDGTPLQTEATGAAVIRLGESGTVAVSLRHPDFVERATRIRVPDEGVVTVSLIPLSHDLTSFEQFAPRMSGLQRWTRNPRMRVLTRAVDYSLATGGFREFPVVDRAFSQTQIDCLVAGMTASLPEMAGGHLSWEGVDIVDMEPGTRIRADATPEGTILVLPAVSLGAGGRGTGYAGADPFVLTRGVVFFDAIFNYCVLSALYRHELGHALGYMHVTGRPSVMAPGGGALQEFDRHSITIVFQRPAGNRLPDQDPTAGSLNVTTSSFVRSIEPVR